MDKEAMVNNVLENIEIEDKITSKDVADQPVPRVVMSHAGAQYTYALALALQQLGALERYYGTLFYHPNHWLTKVLEAFPQSISSKSLKQLKRRDYRVLDYANVDIYLQPELIQRTVKFLLGKNYFTNNVMQHIQNQIFDRYVSKRLKKCSFDIFIGMSGACLHSLRSSKKLGKITMVDQHDIHFSLASQLLSEEIRESPEPKAMPPYWPPHQPYLKTVREEMEIADIILVPSSFSMRSHLQAGIPKEKLILLLRGSVARHGVVYRFPHPQKPFRVLCIGTLTQRKGIKYLLEAVRQLRHNNNLDIEVTLIGDKWGNADFLRPYHEYCRWSGFVSHGELGTYLENSDVLVFPTIYDAFGLNVLDAMATGLPVIVTENCAAGSDIVRDGVDGFVVPIRNTGILYEKLSFLYHNPDVLKKLGESAALRAQEFSVGRYCQDLGDVLRAVVGMHH